MHLILHVCLGCWQVENPSAVTGPLHMPPDHFGPWFDRRQDIMYGRAYPASPRAPLMNTVQTLSRTHILPAARIPATAPTLSCCHHTRMLSIAVRCPLCRYRSFRAVAKGTLQCSEHITEPTIFVTRFEFHNLFHISTDWFVCALCSR